VTISLTPSLFGQRVTFKATVTGSSGTPTGTMTFQDHARVLEKVDGAGNVCIADYSHNAIKEWHATTQKVITLVSSGLISPHGVAVDGAGNVYIADYGHTAIKEWNATTLQVTTLVAAKALDCRLLNCVPSSQLAFPRIPGSSLWHSLCW
jgi:DNA-binding beta-propeller fold protein YncE